MIRERALRVLLILVGLFFVAGIYPLITSMLERKQSDYPDQMMLSIYFVLGIFLLSAVRNPAAHRSLIAFTGWSSLAHDSVMVLQSLQLRNQRTELPPLAVIAFISVLLLWLNLTGQSVKETGKSVPAEATPSRA
jgi:hypothetical protein